MNQARNRAAGNTLFMRIASPAHVVSQEVFRNLICTKLLFTIHLLIFVSQTVPGRSGGSYLKGRGFSSVYSAASAVRFFHRVDARWLSSRFRFPFLFHWLFIGFSLYVPL